MQRISIYLAGSIKKEHEESGTNWGSSEIELLRQSFNNSVPSFLNPALRTDNLADQFSVFGRDMLQVFCSDIVFVDARDRRGLGVGAEMMWAKYNQIPVVTLAPKDSHYHRADALILDVRVEDWVHPFIESLSDKIVESIPEGARWIEQVVTHPKKGIKDFDYIKSAIRHYKTTQLKNDEPMVELLKSDPRLDPRLHVQTMGI